MTDVLEATPETDSGVETAALGGKYLTFLLDGEDYGVDVLKIREIIGVQDITEVPQTAQFLKGVINLRGKVIPAIDLRLKFGLEQADYNEQTCIIVVDVGVQMGIIVDTVCEVHDIAPANIEPRPRIDESNTDFILGMGKVGEDIKVLLDIDKVLTDENLVEWKFGTAD